MGVSDVCWGRLQLGAHVHHVGEEPVEAELCLRPAGEGHHFAQWLWKGKPSGVRTWWPSAPQRVSPTPPCRLVSLRGTGMPSPLPPPTRQPSSRPAWLTVAASPVLGSCSQGADWVRQGPSFLQSVFDLHHLLPSDQGIPADV